MNGSERIPERSCPGPHMHSDRCWDAGRRAGEVPDRRDLPAADEVLTDVEHDALQLAVRAWSVAEPGVQSLNAWSNVLTVVERVLAARAVSAADEAGMVARASAKSVMKRTLREHEPLLGPPPKGLPWCRCGAKITTKAGMWAHLADEFSAALAAEPTAAGADEAGGGS